MKATDSQQNRLRALLLIALALVGGAVVACARPEVENNGNGGYQTDFPITGYGYGNAFHLMFSYDGDPKLATEWRHVSEKGIADDPRVQRFVDKFRDTLASRGFVREDLLWREERALGFLNEPVYRSGYRLADAEETTEIRNGKSEKYYQWRGLDGQFTAGAFEDELAEIGDDFSARRWQFESSLRAVYGRPEEAVGYTDFVELSVANSRVAFNGTEPRQYRVESLYMYGVMGIVAREDAKRPQALVQHVILEISTQPNCPARPIDALIVEALNASLGDDEVIQFYPHSGLDRFGDTDERVQYFAQNVRRSVLIEEPQRKE